MKRGYIIALIVWVLLMIFPMAWAVGTSSALAVWFHRAIRPVWVHVVMHAGMYAVLAGGLRLGLRKRANAGAITLGVVLAAVFLQEGLQKLAAGTLPGWGEVFDLGVDLVGAGAGWLAAGLVIARTQGKALKGVGEQR